MTNTTNEKVAQLNIPDGWKLVPANGTSWDMRNEARELLIDYRFPAAKLDHLVDAVYRAMVNAAPAPPDPPAYPSLTAERDTLKALCVELADALELATEGQYRSRPESKLLKRARSILK